jgi:hypothetical protein
MGPSVAVADDPAVDHVQHPIGAGGDLGVAAYLD